MSEMVQLEINLLGRHFTVATPPEESETLKQAVDLLEEKMGAIQGLGKIVDADRIAIMAALNIAHDLLKTKVGGGLEMAAFQRKIRSMGEAADEALRQSQQALF
jgi:cell division protein ZapA